MIDNPNLHQFGADGAFQHACPGDYRPLAPPTTRGFPDIGKVVSSGYVPEAMYAARM
jgi:hypothetical protein